MKPNKPSSERSPAGPTPPGDARCRVPRDVCGGPLSELSLVWSALAEGRDDEALDWCARALDQIVGRSAIVVPGLDLTVEAAGRSQRTDIDDSQLVWRHPVFANGAIQAWLLGATAPGDVNAFEWVSRITSAVAVVATRSNPVRGDVKAEQLDMPTGTSAFEERARQAIALAQRRNSRVYAYLVDVDRFSRVNESLGRVEGDRLLQLMAKRVAGSIRASDSFIPLRANQYVVVSIQPENEDQGVRVASRILDSIRQPVELAGRTLLVTASIGVASWPGDAEKPADLLRQAEAALTHAKARGGDTFAHVDDAITQRGVDRLAIEADLRRALDLRQLEVFWQPQVDARRRVIGAEALLRWNHPTRGIVPPTDFIPIAENTGMIVEIGRWVIDQTTRQVRAWHDAGLNLRGAVNVSPVQLARDDFAEVLKRIVREAGIESSSLELEVTEGVFVRDTSRAAELLGDLRDFGVKIAIDDFGTGYSSLAYLHCLPIDTLKIDRSFIAQIGTPGDQTIGSRTAVIRSVVSLGKTLGLSLVAEGVESELQFRYLRSLGCDTAQGYFFSKPVPTTEFLDAVARIEGVLARQAA
jgi:diguanylate cyclase (GGDEF)-like protein